MNDSVVVLYNGEPVSVPKEVAEFLDQERKREQAQDKKLRSRPSSLKLCERLSKNWTPRSKT